MIDPADKQTEALPLEPQKRGRGRPSTGQAMTPAEKQRAYRQRLAEQQKSQVPAVQLEKVRSTAAEYLEKLGQQLADAKAETAAAIARAEKAESNVTVNGDTFYNKETVIALELEIVRLRKENKELAQIAQELQKGNVTKYAVNTPKKFEAVLQTRYKGKRRWIDIDRGSKSDMDARARGLNKLAEQGRTDDTYRSIPCMPKDPE